MDEEEKAIERCKELIKPEHSNWIGISSQAAIETVLNLIDKQNKVIDEIRCEFLKYDWKNSNNKQVYNQLKSLYNAIFRKVEEDGKNSNRKETNTND